MNTPKATKINLLLRSWPDSVVKTSAELTDFGVNKYLARRYAQYGWIVPVGRGAYAKPQDKVTRLGALHGVQYKQSYSVHAGGRTALELNGYSHYATTVERDFFLFGPPHSKLPTWFRKYFGNVIVFKASSFLPLSMKESFSQHDTGSFIVTTSAPERAALELLYHVPGKVGFDEALQILSGMGTLRPSLMQKLLEQCSNIKVKRLFLYLARESGHRWYKDLKKGLLDLGSGKRVIVKGGKLDKEFQITVPTMSEEGLF